MSSSLFSFLKPALRMLPVLGLATLMGVGAQSEAVASQHEMRAPIDPDALGVLAPDVEVPQGWVSQRGALVQIHSHPDHQRHASRLLRHAESSLPELSRRLGVGTGDTIEVFLAPDDATFEAIQPGNPPDWADGVAWPSRGLVYLHAPEARLAIDEPLEQVLDHELVHILLGRAFAPRPVPHWLQEGAAQLLAGQIRPEQRRDLARAVWSGLPTLAELTSRFPDDPARAQAAYAQSAAFLSWLHHEGGPETLPRLTAALARGEDLAGALHAATGRELPELENEWRASVVGSPWWLEPLFSGETMMTLGALGLVVGWRRVRKNRELALARMAEQERLQEQTYRNLAGHFPGRAPLPVRRPRGLPRFAHPQPMV
jgi:hypothetical protein